MAVAQPEVLLILNESSGTNVTNYGSVSTDATVSNGVENTDWAWHQDAGTLDGYWECITEGGDDMGWISLTAITTSAAQASIWRALAFNLTAWDTRASNVGHVYHGNENGKDIEFQITSPTSTGDFDMTVSVSDRIGNTRTITYADLSFSTVYSIVAAVDASTPTASFLKTKLDNGSVQTSTTWNLPSNPWDDAYGYIGRRHDFSNYYGIEGNVYYLAGTNGALLSDSDMADINSDPAANITGWPSAGSSVGLGRLAGGRLVGGILVGSG